MYGLKVTNCIVKDGLGWSEQPLINNDGCPIDPDVMGPLEYSKNLTLAQVTYPAHKFPFTASVYYKCNVKLCAKRSGGCDDVPPICDPTGHNVRRRRRKRQSGELQDRGSLEKLRLQDEDLRDKSVEVYGGLYVNEVDDDEETGESFNPLTTKRPSSQINDVMARNSQNRDGGYCGNNRLFTFFLTSGLTWRLQPLKITGFEITGFRLLGFFSPPV
ncbi:hypothetical protein AVEN_8376-1 [Araneus ventricosus]|uniref:ZP domain-containing protein n=1 Tax=Araneus ventricosus TaxID=182803 RepID=A0A4Y2SF79_ARAVE|nr:hypothetical protein AVEN_8376-1 [Araneus ventricosus]